MENPAAFNSEESMQRLRKKKEKKKSGVEAL